jgi:hypothetical protein
LYHQRHSTVFLRGGFQYGALYGSNLPRYRALCLISGKMHPSLYRSRYSAVRCHVPWNRTNCPISGNMHYCTGRYTLLYFFILGKTPLHDQLISTQLKSFSKNSAMTPIGLLHFSRKKTCRNLLSHMALKDYSSSNFFSLR